jgi:hypothetical protein
VPSAGVGNERFDPGRQGIGVAWFDKPGGPIVLEYLADLIEIGRDDRLAHRHVLEELRR